MKIAAFAFSLLTVVNGALRAAPQISIGADDIGGTTSCACKTDYDCLRSPYCPNTSCVLDKYTGAGQCKKIARPPTKPPTKAPTKAPTKPPTKPPTRPPIKQGTCSCQSDYDCQRSPYCPDKCVFSRYSNVGQCQNGVIPTMMPTVKEQQCCDNPRNIPTECEVRLLIQIMETAVGINFGLFGQWLRLSFHDAGSFDQQLMEGGANGCLLTFPPMRTMPENSNLDLALNTLAAVKNNWEGHADTCLDVSAADMIQFAGLFSVIRQKDTPGLTTAKRDELVQTMMWGREDEQNCQTSWTNNLPGFQLGTNPTDIPLRCVMAGGEIKEKMMDRNGFTAIEATALMGAHSIGLTRNVFGSALASKWSHNGGDHATAQGPKFGNGFHHYLEFDVVEETATDFATNIAAFDVPFPDWFRQTNTGVGHLDTDMALAFPSGDTNVHPHFNHFTEMFANDNTVFMKHFMEAFRKMSTLGVFVPLVHALSCSEGCEGASTSPVPILTIEETQTVKAVVEDAVAEASVQLNETLVERAEVIKDDTTPIRLVE